MGLKFRVHYAFYDIVTISFVIIQACMHECQVIANFTTDAYNNFILADKFSEMYPFLRNFSIFNTLFIN